MKKIKILFLLLTLISLPNIALGYTMPELTEILGAIAMELFITIHMTVFVIMPLSKMISPENEWKTFKILFFGRIFILLFFDFIIPIYIFLIDFFTVFIGAFIVVPIFSAVTQKNAGTSSYTIKTTKIKNENNYKTEVRTTYVTRIPSEKIDYDSEEVDYKEYEKIMENYFDSPENIEDTIKNYSNEKTHYDETINNFESNDATFKEKIDESNFNNDPISDESSFNYERKGFIFFGTLKNFILSIAFIVASFYAVSAYAWGKSVFSCAAYELIIIIIYKIFKSNNGTRVLERQGGVGFATITPSEVIKIGVLLCISIICAVISYSKPHFVYEEDYDGTYTLAKISRSIMTEDFTTVNIPSHHKTKQVTRIKENALAGLKIKTVELPNTIKTIGKRAFYKCNQLESITIPENVTLIEKEAFYECENLSYVNILADYINIKEKAFSWCTKLHTVIMPLECDFEYDVFEGSPVKITYTKENKTEDEIENKTNQNIDFNNYIYNY